MSCRLCNEVCCANCAPLRQLPTEYDDDNFLGYAARKKLKNICNVCTYILDVLKYDVIQVWCCAFSAACTHIVADFDLL